MEKPEVLFEKQNPCGCTVQLLKGTLPSPTGIDFITKYLDPTVSKYYRTPKHEHIATDIVAKRASNPNAFPLLIAYFRGLLEFHNPTTTYPTINQVGQYQMEDRKKIISSFTTKDIFHITDLIDIYELIMWQEITRYPNGRLSGMILDCLNKGDIFSAINHATRKQ